MISNATDELVCGSGLAGHCAALTAAECGAEVLFVEKMVSPGGRCRRAEVSPLLVPISRRH
jgi:succinate dehydrogenase/fumarate reductase flavoprotein subunit